LKFLFSYTACVILTLTQTFWESLNAVMLLVAVLVAWFFIFALKRMLSCFNDNMVATIRRRLKRESQLRPLTAAGHQQVNELLRKVLNEFSAARVCVFQFHNGDKFMLSNHVWKVSCSHEVLAPEVRPLGPAQSQNLQVGSAIEWVGPVVDPTTLPAGVKRVPVCLDKEATCPAANKGHVVLHYVINEMDVSVSQALSNDLGIRHAFVINLVEPKSKIPFGFMAVHFGRHDDQQVLEALTKVCFLCPIAQQIQFFLTTDFEGFRKPRKVWPWERS